MKKPIFFKALFTLAVVFPYSTQAQTSAWQDVETVSGANLARAASANWFSLMPDAYRLLKLDEPAMQTSLSTSGRGIESGSIITIPLPDGSQSRWRVTEDPILEPKLAAQFPEIKTYAAIGLDENTYTGRLDFTAKGFHAMLDTESGPVFIDPRSAASGRYYISYFKHDYHPAEKTSEPRRCGVDDSFLHADHGSAEFLRAAFRNRQRLTTQALPVGAQTRNYSLAVATTGEYTAFHGGINGAVGAITTTINRVNQIYIRDVAVRLNVIGNNRNLIYTNAATDPYTNNDGIAMLGENQTNIDNVIRSANYDVGHVFSTGGGGVATLGVPCRNGLKARGVTGSPSPIGDPFDVDFVAHEIGHQFGATHTFNSTSGACGGGNREQATSHEPGSGVTVMGYAGICGANNLQANSIAMFSAVSINQITDYVGGGIGASCDNAPTNTGNTPPVASAGTSGSIPANTPFELTGSGIDANTLTYSWEQFDAGTASNVNVDAGNNAIFRPFLPSASPTRVFPKLSAVLQGATSTFGEVLPNTTRAMNFRLVVRDNFGGVSSAALAVPVRNTGQPFSMTSQNAGGTIAGGQTFGVSWNVAGTSAPPINCSAVNISLSLNGGNTFPIEIAKNTPNDGSHSVRLPTITTASTQGRLKVKCANSIFFDINNANLIVQAGSGGSDTIAPIQLLLLDD